MKLTDLLTPPAKCGMYMGLPFRDKRRGGFWYCDHARKIVGKGRAAPACLCHQVITEVGRTALQSGER